MIDDPELLNRRTAYVQTLRNLYRRERLAGFLMVALGVLLLVWIQMQRPAPLVPLIGDGVLLVVGWTLILYATIRRGRWAAAHPFEPNA